MNKSELVDAVASKTGLTKTQSSDAIDAVVAAIQETLKGGEQVNLVGFGVFLTGDRAARTGRNPRTGEEIQIPAARLPKFKPGKGLRDAVALPKVVAPVKATVEKTVATVEKTVAKAEKTATKAEKSGKKGSK
ncbi:MAG: HU family DNA-binding protein [Magnetococcales bacterium]|nr:HU family DNA-binding protein [Magnetococcales bacterium]